MMPIEGLKCFSRAVIGFNPAADGREASLFPSACIDKVST